VDIHFQLGGDQFVWDDEKAAENIRKHGIAFEVAAEVFMDPFTEYEDASTDREAREAAIGFTRQWNLLFVVHLVREDDIIRIISARLTTAKERMNYENNV
jgi:uncharacterized protein